ncbi:MAG: mechanosensitive ion channel family protein [Tissierella sp.]|uniref:mechanosensitive ion channel family protein n=1 Tax=Tissierella sp. TaxID=41274 RepID=UPI003F99D019
MENILQTTLIPFVKDLALAIVVLVVGLFLIGKLAKLVGKEVEKSKIDNTLKSFIVSLVSGLLKVLLAISVVGILGVETSSFVAVLAAGGFAIGLAFQGALSNFAGGVLLLVVRPISVGDYIDADGFSGTVEAIQILNTILRTTDNKVIYIPNGNLANTNIINYSVKETRRAEWIFGVGYDEDVDKVKDFLKDIINSHPLVLKDPEPFVKMTNHGDSSVDFKVRAWAKAGDLWDLHYDVLEIVKKRFDKEKIEMPFPQMDLHMEE